MRLRSVAPNQKIKAFVSAFGGGSDDWYDLLGYFDESWSRHGWALVVFADQSGTQRKGVYLDVGSKTVDITFNEFNKDLEIVYH